jgi:hypothetical protein
MAFCVFPTRVHYLVTYVIVTDISGTCTRNRLHAVRGRPVHFLSRHCDWHGKSLCLKLLKLAQLLFVCFVWIFLFALKIAISTQRLLASWKKQDIFSLILLEIIITFAFLANGAICGAVVQRPSPLPVMSVPPVVSGSNHSRGKKFSDWYEASNEQVVRGFLRVLRLPPLPQLVMVQPTKLK